MHVSVASQKCRSELHRLTNESCACEAVLTMSTKDSIGHIVTKSSPSASTEMFSRRLVSTTCSLVIAATLSEGFQGATLRDDLLVPFAATDLLLFERGMPLLTPFCEAALSGSLREEPPKPPKAAELDGPRSSR